MNRFSQRYLIAFIFAAIAMSTTSALAYRAKPYHRKEKEQKVNRTEDFVLTTKFAKKESYELIIPKSIIDKASGNTKTSSIFQWKTIFAGISIALAVLSVLVLLRRSKSPMMLNKATVTGAVLFCLSFASLSYLYADLAPIEPRPIKDKVTIKVTANGGHIELIHYVKPKRRKRTYRPM